MTRSDAERRAYGRGYNAGMHGNWPNLATIPDERYRRLAQAAEELAGSADTFLAQMDFDDRETDPHQVALDAAIDAVREEILRAHEHCRNPPDESAR